MRRFPALERHDRFQPPVVDRLLVCTRESDGAECADECDGISGNASASVSWTAPFNGGSTITGYTVTSSPDGVTATTAGATSVVVPGLTNGVSYTFTVTATNSIGTSDPSAPSNSVTPQAPTRRMRRRM